MTARRQHDDHDDGDSGAPLPVEYPLRVVIGGIEVATLLCTPERLDDLALGWAYAQGALAARAAVDIEQGAAGAVARLDAPPRELAWRRYAVGGFDAGVLLAEMDARVPDGAGLRADAFERQARLVFERFRALRGAGGYHHAGLMDETNIHSVIADISRHNAVDKVVGDALRRGINPAKAAIVLSGRITADIALKAARLGVPVIATRSLPTQQAVELAEAAGLLLICRVLDHRRVDFGARQRLLGPPVS